MSVDTRTAPPDWATNSYTFATEPRPIIRSRKKFRDDQLQRTKFNIMTDPRIRRGNTLSLPPSTIQAEQKEEEERQKRLKKAQRQRERQQRVEEQKPSTPPPVSGRQSKKNQQIDFNLFFLFFSLLFCFSLFLSF